MTVWRPSQSSEQILHHQSFKSLHTPQAPLRSATTPMQCTLHFENLRKLCGKLPDFFLLRQRRVRKVAETGGNWRKVAESRGNSRKVAESHGNLRKVAEIRGNGRKAVAQQLALRDAYGSLHRHTLLLHKWFFTFVEGCAVLALGNLASSSVTRLPPRDVTALETTD